MESWINGMASTLGLTPPFGTQQQAAPAQAAPAQGGSTSGYLALAFAAVTLWYLF